MGSVQGIGLGSGGWVVLCMCESIIWIDGRSMHLYIVICGYLRILGAPSVQSYCTLSIYASYHDYVFCVV